MNATNTGLLEWITAAKAERRAYRAWQRALPLAPIRRGPDQYAQPWVGVVDRLRAEHAAARDALHAAARAARNVTLDPVDEYGWQRIRVEGIECGAALRVTPSGYVVLSSRNEKSVHRNVESALGSWNFVGMLLDFNA
ncbi:hypothetical protein [Nocardia otitidiscaviarum]|uniref:hypothetical protein n=1 Tax=Nocardia otitidiscaviarum TaxID=1823 RepID=UPI0004A74AE1|nr:hypothetical protein [Nocardia otitidiscaviarum]